MSKCKNCGKEYEGKGRSEYCSNTCKQAFYRNRLKGIDDRNVTIAETKAVTIESYEDLPLDVREEINRMTAWCETRGVEDDRATRIKKALHYQKLFPGRGSEPPGFTGKMTGQSAEICPIPKDQRKPYINYGPYMTASELAVAGKKFNRVSKPGDADYDGIVTPEWRAERCA